MTSHPTSDVLRAEFEKWCSQWPQINITCNRGIYLDDYTHAAWEGWQARAALERCGEDAQDAKRYRWLRDHANNQNGPFIAIRSFDIVTHYNGHWADQEVDEAIQTTKDKK